MAMGEAGNKGAVVELARDGIGIGAVVGCGAVDSVDDDVAVAVVVGMVSKSGRGSALGSGEFWKAPPAQRSCLASCAADDVGEEHCVK